MRVLGIDPGLTRCGLAVVSAQGNVLTCEYIDVVRTDPAQPLQLRLLAVERAIEAIVERFTPDVVAIERVFSQHNVTTAMGTAQSSAMGLLVAARGGLEVAMHTPSEVKASVTGNGRAGKAQVIAMVTRILKLPQAPKTADAADAAAIAICQLWRGPALARLAAAGARP